MKGNRYTTEQIIKKLQEAEVELANKMTVKEMCRKLEIHFQTYYKWRRKYGAMTISEARRLKQLEMENRRLKRIVANQMLDIEILKEFNKGKY
jgi:putative transposase